MSSDSLMFAKGVDFACIRMRGMLRLFMLDLIQTAVQNSSYVAIVAALIALAAIRAILKNL
jgi:predicted YcjX-like family ATPase